METIENSVMVDVSIRLPDAKGNLVSVFETQGKLSKSAIGKGSREHIYVYIRPGEGGDYSKAVVSISYSGDAFGDTKP